MKKLLGREEVSNRESHIIDSIKSVLKNKWSYGVLFSVPINFSIYFSIQAVIGIKFLQDIRGFTAVRSSNYTFIMMLCTISVMLFSGMLSKALGNKRKIFLMCNGVLVFSSVLLVLLSVIYNLPAYLFLIAFSTMAFCSGFAPVNVSLMKEVNHPDRAAISVGTLNTVVYVLVAVMSQLIGMVLDRYSASAVTEGDVTIYPKEAYVTLFSILLGCSVISMISSFFNKETYGENIYFELTGKTEE